MYLFGSVAHYIGSDSGDMFNLIDNRQSEDGCGWFAPPQVHRRTKKKGRLNGGIDAATRAQVLTDVHSASARQIG
jgi:hypothetical protein